MVLDLLRAGHKVLVLGNLSRGHRNLIPGGIFAEGDLGYARFLDRVFTEHKIDAVMYLAAYLLVGESVKKPLAYYRNNISRTIELLETMVRHSV